MNVSIMFKHLRASESSHLGLGDIRLTIEQQDAICEIFPADIIEKYKSWKIEHPNKGYQYDEIKEFMNTLSRGELVDIMEGVLKFYTQ